MINIDFRRGGYIVETYVSCNGKLYEVKCCSTSTSRNVVLFITINGRTVRGSGDCWDTAFWSLQQKVYQEFEMNR